MSQATTAGVGRFLENAVIDQQRRGWEVSLASPPEERLIERCREVGATHLRWHAVRSPLSGLMSEGRSLARIITDVDPDVVLLHSSKAGLVGRLVLRGSRPTIFRPAAWSFLEGSRPVKTAALAWERWAARWTTTVLCVSEGERRRGESAGVRVRAGMIPNAVDHELFHPASSEERDAIRSARGMGRDPAVVCVGRLAVQKGQDILLSAWPLILEQAPTARLFLVGDGPDRPTLEQRGVPRVEFVGQQENIREWMVAADVIAQPSRWEGASFVTLEAMACGRSVVVSDVDGAQEVLGSVGGASDAGAVVPIGDVRQLAAAIADRLAEPRLAEMEGARALDRSRSFDLRSWGDAVADLIITVAQSRSSTA